jgi:putative ABC transport system permease protein
MSLFKKISLRLRSLLRRSTAELELDEEFAFHLEKAVDENVRHGMSHQEAVVAASRSFGIVALEKERCRDARGLAWLEDLRQDLTYGARNLIKSPAFTAVALLSLALGIGATTALFSMVNAVVLHGIPFPQPARVVMIKETKHGASTGGNPARFRDWSDELKSFSAVTGFYSDNTTLLGRGEATKIGVMRVTGHYFDVTGIAPARGRAFTDDELAKGASVAVVNHALGRDPSETIDLSGRIYTIVGVMPPTDPLLDDVEVWTPMPLDILATSRKAGFLGEVARLAPGVSIVQAQAEITHLAQSLARQHPETDRALTAEISLLQDELLRKAKTSMLLLSATVGFVLLIACVNIAGMLLSRSARRHKESAIRVALGAGRARLVRMLLTESLLLSIVGGLLGLAFAPAALPLLRLVLPTDLPSLATAHVDLTAAALTFAVAVVCGLLAGCAPAWQLSSASPLTAMKETGFVSRMRLRRGLVVSEIAISFVLLAGAGLLARSFAAMISQPLGFQPDQAIAVNVSFPWDTPPARLDAFYSKALERMSALNGVRAVGLIDRLPLSGGSQDGHMVRRDRPIDSNAPFEQVGFRAARGQYFAAIGAPMVAGSPLANRAPRDDQRKTVVNQALATRYFPGENPIGKFIGFDSHNWYQIAGVVGNIRQDALKDTPPEVFVLSSDTHWPEMKIVLRAQGDPRTLAAAARSVIHEIDPSQPVDSIETLDEHVRKSSAKQAMHAWLLGGFATLALLLAAIGIYGLMASDVAQRTREIGLRVALGADHRGVLSLIIRGGMALACSGAAIGAVAAWLFFRYLRSILFGIEATDFVAFAGAVLLVLTVAAVAILIPAIKALKLDPVAILRHE